MTNTIAPPTERRPRRAWTIDAVRDLGLTTDIETAGEIIGIGRSTAYELASAGQFPVRVLRIGRRYIVPVTALTKLLDADRPAE